MTLRALKQRLRDEVLALRMDLGIMMEQVRLVVAPLCTLMRCVFQSPRVALPQPSRWILGLHLMFVYPPPPHPLLPRIPPPSPLACPKR